MPSDPPPAPLVSLTGVRVARPGGAVVLRDVTWTIRDGETWAVVGPVGSGKTTLAETLLGRHHLTAGSIEWPLIDRLRAAGRRVDWPADVVRFVSFKEESRLFSYGQHYYQERFDFADAENNLTLETFLSAGTAASADDVRRAARDLGIDGLLPVTFIKLSNGQVRRARIARAVLAQPELLVLDEPFMGLDAEGRDELAGLLGRLIDTGLRVVLVTRPATLPAWATHVAEVRDGQLAWQGPRADYAPPLPQPPGTPAAANPERQRRGEVLHPVADAPGSPGSLVAGGSVPGQAGGEPEVRGDAFPTRGREREEGSGGVGLLEPVIEFEHVTVRYGDRAILNDVTWTVRRGERWAVLGPNGAGKTTLLSLVCGDHPQAYSNRVRLFGRQRGTGESIWEVKRRVGLVSPELHLYFTTPLTAAQAAATGFFDVLAYRPTTPEQAAAVRDLFAAFGITALADRPFARLSTGEQRLVLLARALVKRPSLLVLDEPFQGLDEALVGRARDWLDAHLAPDQTLLFVTHYEAEIPACVTRRLRLRAGEVAAVE